MRDTEQYARLKQDRILIGRKRGQGSGCIVNSACDCYFRLREEEKIRLSGSNESNIDSRTRHASAGTVYRVDNNNPGKLEY